MPAFTVTVPLKGFVQIETEGESAEDAVKRVAHEVGAKITDLNGYEGTDANPAESRVWVADLMDIQVQDHDATVEEEDLTLVDAKIFHTETKRQFVE